MSPDRLTTATIRRVAMHSSSSPSHSSPILLALTFTLLLLASTVTAVRLRGAFDIQNSPFQSSSQSSSSRQQQQQQQQRDVGPLVSFLQSHQQAFTQQQHEPSEQAQQIAQSTMPAPGAQAAASAGHGDFDLLKALEQATNTQTNSLVQTDSSVEQDPPSGGDAGGGGTFGPCKTCVFVLERIKKGSNMLLPAICSELYHKYPDAYAQCHQVLNALSINGNNVRYWLFEGCFKYEIYQSKEWIKPCPSHVMCSVLKDLSAAPFCPALPMENPFTDA